MNASMKSSTVSSRQWQELTIRNQRLAMEVARLQELNRILRKKIHEINKTQLHLSSAKVDRAMQTENDLSFGNGEPESAQKFREGNPRSILFDTLQLLSPPIIQDDRVSTRRKSHRRSSVLALEVSERILFASPLGVSSVSKEEPGATSKVPSPCQERVHEILATQVCNSEGQSIGTSTKSLAFSPPRTLQRRNSVSTRRDSDTADLRTPRSTKKPVSYQEPSLRVKVRKGFKFFQFT